MPKLGIPTSAGFLGLLLLKVENWESKSYIQGRPSFLHM
jgi:hypothetical protein